MLAALAGNDVAAVRIVMSGEGVQLRVGVAFNDRTLLAPLWKLHDALRPRESEQFLLTQANKVLPAAVPAHVAMLERTLERHAPGAVRLVDRYSHALAERQDVSDLREALRKTPIDTAVQLLYWKHSKELHAGGRVPITKLSGLGNRPQYLVLREHPLRARCPCPMCGEPAQLAVAFVVPARRSDVRLLCPACSHHTSVEFIESDSRIQDFPVAMCPCEVCDSVRNEWAERLYDWCHTFSARLAELLKETARGVAGAYLGRGSYRLSTRGNLSQRGAPLGRFAEYLVASTLAAGPPRTRCAPYCIGERAAFSDRC